MKPRQINILSITGFDPCGGAGLLADHKTITALKSYALSVCTANTIQTDTNFSACHWTAKTIIIEQLNVLLNQYKIAAVKIGILEDFELLESIVSLIKAIQPNTKIILDPVLRSSTSFTFHDKSIVSSETLGKIDLITPNYEEILKLGKSETLEETLSYLQQYTNILLKGGHHPETIGLDVLYTKSGNKYPLQARQKQQYYPKHGSGCVLASAIATYLGQGYTLHKSCLKAKRYVERFLGSSKTLLGYHSI